jgi:hypothetical protein
MMMDLWVVLVHSQFCLPCQTEQVCNIVCHTACYAMLHAIFITCAVLVLTGISGAARGDKAG